MGLLLISIEVSLRPGIRLQVSPEMSAALEVKVIKSGTSFEKFYPEKLQVSPSAFSSEWVGGLTPVEQLMIAMEKIVGHGQDIGLLCTTVLSSA